MSMFNELTHEQRLALLHRLQSGAPIWRPQASTPRFKPVVKPVVGDKNPQGKAAARRRKQILRDQQAQLARGFKAFEGLVGFEALDPAKGTITIASSVASNPGEMDTPGIPRMPKGE